VDGGESFEEALSMPNPKLRWGTQDVGPDGTLYLAGVYNTLLPAPGHIFVRSPSAALRSETPAFDRVQRLNLGGSTALAGARVNPIGLIGQVWIAADRSNTPRRGNVYLLTTIALPADEDNDLDVVFLRSEDGGLTWSTPRRVHDDPVDGGAKQWFGTMSVAPNGRIDAIWNDTRNDPGQLMSEVFYSFSTDGGATWSPNQPVSPPFNPTLGYPHNAKIGDYYHMVSDNGGASLAYAATFNGEQDIYFLRLPVDCNGNGIEDDCEISCADPSNRCHVAGCGTGSDRNGDGILDACESLPLVADAGGDQVVECSLRNGASVVLDGSGSYDPDGDPLLFTWSDEHGQVLGMGRTLSVPLSLGSHVLTLVVDDGRGATASDTVSVLVRDTLPPALECEPGDNPGASASASAAHPPPSAAAGFYVLSAVDVCSADPKIYISDAKGSGPFGPFSSGTRLKITQAPGSQPALFPMGSPSGSPGSLILHLRLPSDPVVTALDASSNSTTISCGDVPPRR
jgi:hypothetical protein